MEKATAQRLIENLAETLVLMDASGSSAFIPCVSSFTEIRDWAALESLEAVVTACEEAIQCVAAVLEEKRTPEETHPQLCEITSRIQHVVCHDLDSGHVFLAFREEDEEGISPLSPMADERILGEFLTRQELVLDELEGLLLSLERDRGEEAMLRCKRIVHTLKGESSLLGMTPVERLCHAMEDALAELRLDALFEAKDWLAQSFNHYAGKGDRPKGLTPLIGKLNGNKPMVSVEIPGQADNQQSGLDIEATVTHILIAEGTDPTLVSDFIHESNEHLEAADLHLMNLETDPANGESLNATFRAFHTIKGVAGFIGVHPIRMLAHETESLLDLLRSGSMRINPSLSDLLFQAVDNMRKLIGMLDPSVPTKTGVGLREIIVRIQAAARGDAPLAKAPQELPVSKSTIPVKPKFGEILVQTGVATAQEIEVAVTQQRNNPGERLGETLVKEGVASALDVAQALRSQHAAQQASVAVRETVKVEAERLDKLLDTIGELVIAETMIAQSPELRGKISSVMVQRLVHLDKITRHLQELGTSLRMVPIRPVFQKMTRLARDLSKKCGKQLDFITAGEETELDKSVVDRIADPLVHMVRNAVDHGIEPDGETREANGKNRTARLKLSAYQKGGSICIELEDDGRGLNREAILNKARTQGLIKGTGAELEDREVWPYIFEPGFSTASQVTEVSGRGVGMDVVKRTIEELRGRMEIQTTPGKGTRFTIWLPLTMAIIDGMVVKVGAERCIFPTLTVTTVIPYHEAESTPVLGRGLLVHFQGRPVPVYPLRRYFEHLASEPSSQQLIVMVETGGRILGFIVDALLGKQQIVIKSLGDTFKDIPGLAGGGILSDGSIGLILDVDSLAKSLIESSDVSQSSNSSATPMATAA